MSLDGRLAVFPYPSQQPVPEGINVNAKGDRIRVYKSDSQLRWVIDIHQKVRKDVTVTYCKGEKEITESEYLCDPRVFIVGDHRAALEGIPNIAVTQTYYRMVHEQNALVEGTQVNWESNVDQDVEGAITTQLPTNTKYYYTDGKFFPDVKLRTQRPSQNASKNAQTPENSSSDDGWQRLSTGGEKYFANCERRVA